MKTLSVDLLTHISGGTTTLATLWHITRTDGVVYRLTDHDQDIVYDGETYSSSSGYDRTAVSSAASMDPDNVDLTGFYDSAYISDIDVRKGLLDYATVRVFAINWEDPSQGAVKLHSGNLGEVVTTSKGFFKTELRGLTQRLQQTTGELFSPECRADLGDFRCKIAIDPPEVARNSAYEVGEYVKYPNGTGSPYYDKYANRIYKCTTAGTSSSSPVSYTRTLGATQVDGSASFLAQEAWNRDATVSGVTNSQYFQINVTDSRAVDDWFNHGVILFETGNNSGLRMEVQDWVASGGHIETFMEFPFDVQVGDRLTIYPGCDKRFQTCKAKFNNVINMRAEPYLPGIDAVLRYAEPK